MTPVPTGITETLIRDLVHAFYARVRADPERGPVFDRAWRIADSLPRGMFAAATARAAGGFA
jgi:truncated hemoglobin YjbI